MPAQPNIFSMSSKGSRVSKQNYLLDASHVDGNKISASTYTFQCGSVWAEAKRKDVRRCQSGRIPFAPSPSSRDLAMRLWRATSITRWGGVTRSTCFDSCSVVGQFLNIKVRNGCV